MTHQVSLVLRLADGFRGSPVASAASVCVSLNGRAARPLYKPGGWFVFADLPAGDYRVRITGPGFRPVERRAVVTGGPGYPELYCVLTPAEDYPFGRSAVRLYGLVTRDGIPVAGGEVLLARAGRGPVKLAEDGAREGREALRLFLPSRDPGRWIPGEFLLLDRERSEEVFLLEEREGLFRLAAPLRYTHKRGVALQPARRYRTGEDGRFFAAFPGGEEWEVYLPDASGYRRYAIHPGEREQNFAF